MTYLQHTMRDNHLYLFVSYACLSGPAKCMERVESREGLNYPELSPESTKPSPDQESDESQDHDQYTYVNWIVFFQLQNDSIDP